MHDEVAIAWPVPTRAANRSSSSRVRGPLVALVLEGESAVAAARQLIGATNPLEADAGSIRGEFATEVTFNLVHGSDSPESAEREIELWFPEL